MGAFLSQLVGKLLGDSQGGSSSAEAGHSEVDHNAIVCCGTMTVTEVEHDETQMQEEKGIHK
jgi:hypothetical protein